MTITECKYYRDKDKECDVWGIPCEMKDCYFKELKRLEQENERLKEEKDKYYQQTLDDEIQINELLHTLQEIKAIAERAFAVCDDDCGNANKFQEIIELTKAEEE